MTIRSQNLMVGVPTGYLSPQIPPPTSSTTSVGIELAPGIGISLDGRALLVGPQPTDGVELNITGHLSDGTYPDRDFVVTQENGKTQIHGHYERQNYTLMAQPGGFSASSSEHRFQMVESAEGFEVKSASLQFAAVAQRTTVRTPERTYTVLTEGDTTRVTSADSALDFSVTRRQDGSQFIDGKLATQDFTFSAPDPTEGGWVLQGHYPQQRFELSLV